MAYENTQSRPGHLHSLSSNPASAGSGDGQDVLAGDGLHVTSDTYPHEVSSNPHGAGSGRVEGQELRGYVHNDSGSTPAIKNTSAGRCRNI